MSYSVDDKLPENYFKEVMEGKSRDVENVPRGSR